MNRIAASFLIFVSSLALATTESPFITVLDAEQWEDALEMLANDPSVINERDSLGLSPLHSVISRAPENVVIKLLKATNQAVLAEIDTLGNTIFHNGVHYQSVEVLREIIRRAPQLLRVANVRGRYPLHEGLDYMSDPKVDLMLEIARAYPQAIRQVDNDGNTPLSIAIANQNSALVLSLAELAPDLIATHNDVPELQRILTPAAPQLFATFQQFEEAVRQGVLDDLDWPLFFAGLSRFSKPKSDPIVVFSTSSGQFKLLTIYHATLRNHSKMLHSLARTEAEQIVADYENFMFKAIRPVLLEQAKVSHKTPSTLDALYFWLHQSEMAIKRSPGKTKEDRADQIFASAHIRRLIAFFAQDPELDAAVAYRETLYTNNGMDEIIDNMHNYAPWPKPTRSNREKR